MDPGGTLIGAGRPDECRWSLHHVPDSAGGRSPVGPGHISQCRESVRHFPYRSLVVISRVVRENNGDFGRDAIVLPVTSGTAIVAKLTLRYGNSGGYFLAGFLGLAADLAVDFAFEVTFFLAESSLLETIFWSFSACSFWACAWSFFISLAEREELSLFEDVGGRYFLEELL